MKTDCISVQWEQENSRTGEEILDSGCNFKKSTEH